MSYIWEEYDKELYYYVPKFKQSYYQEVWKREGKFVPVNLYNRFMDVFYRNEDRENEKRIRQDNKFKDIVNVSVHLLSQMDRLRGISLEDIKMSLVFDDITNDLYGEEIREIVHVLEYRELYIILKELVKSIDTQNKECVFDETLKLIFGKVNIYKEKSTDKTIVYIESIRSEYRERVFKLVCLLFADIALSLECFWANEHFGVIGAYSTMRIDRLHIY
jgi:hypothetical protein